MWIRILIGGGAGLLIGALLGTLGKCRAGTCPLTGSPYTGALFGAILGAAIAMSLHSQPPQKAKESPMTQPTPTVTMKGKPVSLTSQAVNVGDQAPDFVAVDTDLKEVHLSDYRGKVVLLLSVPSLDTSVCSLETRRFNEAATGLGNDVAVLVVSMDLPFAQKRWCGAEGVKAVRTLSDHRQASFGQGYGVLIGDLRLLARAVFVVGRDGKVRYKQLVGEVSSEPDYDAALEAVGEAVKG